MQDQSKSEGEIDRSETCQRVEEQQAENRKRLWTLIQQIGERNADMDPDEVMRIVTEVVEEVRQERYEREQCAARSR